MSKKSHAPGPVPPGNRPKAGPGAPEVSGDEAATSGSTPGDGAAFAEQDPQRRLGDYETAGEHSFVQPGGKNDAQRDKGNG